MKQLSNKYDTWIINFILLMFATFLAGGIGLYAQNDTTNLVKYTPDFEFSDGIFLSFDQVKNNDPILKSRILTTVDYNDRDFFDRLTQEKEIAFYDNFGVKKSVPTSRIWGYSDNGVLYIYLNKSFNRITVVGSICHFVANLTTYYNNNTYDPYNYYNSYSYRMRTPYYGPSQQTELRQYVLDFETGKVFDYEVKSVEILLMSDPELTDEYNSLRKKKKKQLKFFYIRKFNERNPLYLPAG